MLCPVGFRERDSHTIWELGSDTVFVDKAAAAETAAWSKAMDTVTDLNYAAKHQFSVARGYTTPLPSLPGMSSGISQQAVALGCRDVSLREGGFRIPLGWLG